MYISPFNRSIPVEPVRICTYALLSKPEYQLVTAGVKEGATNTSKLSPLKTTADARM